MSRSRCQLHLTKLDEFAAYCATKGFVRVEPLANAYEVLRMTKKGSEPVIVHARMRASEHGTTWGMSQRMLQSWFSARNSAQQRAPNKESP